MNSRFGIALGSLLLAGFVLAACSGEDAGQGNGQGQMPPAAVTVAVLAEQSVTLTRELPGRTYPYKVAEVRPQVNGIVREQLFTEGSVVEAGQPLYQLDDATYRADYDSARASLRRTEAAVEIARLNADRVAELVETGAVSRQEYDNAMATLQQAEADVGVARAAMASSKVRLDYARITSPITGRIGKSTVTAGALVTANQAQALATVRQLDPIYVDLSQSANELLALRKALEAGTVEATDDYPVSILLEDSSVFEHEGRLAFSEVSVEPSTGSFLLRVLVPNPEHLLMPGMYVRAVVGRGVRDNAILVPQQGIQRDPKGNTYALLVSDDDTVEQREVKVSRTLGNKWLVESGLSAGERVIIEGVQKARPGAPVQVTETVSMAGDADSQNHNHNDGRDGNDTDNDTDSAASDPDA